MEERDPLTERIIGSAIKVHRKLGPGLLESAYETALAIQLARDGLKFDKQREVPLFYEGIRVGDYKPDFIVENAVVLEIKSVLKYEPVFLAQMLTYLRITGLNRVLILNFNKAWLKAGIKRVILSEHEPIHDL